MRVNALQQTENGRSPSVIQFKCIATGVTRRRLPTGHTATGTIFDDLDDE
jgi:hypothetical protein